MKVFFFLVFLINSYIIQVHSYPFLFKSISYFLPIFSHFFSYTIFYYYLRRRGRRRLLYSTHSPNDWVCNSNDWAEEEVGRLEFSLGILCMDDRDSTTWAIKAISQGLCRQKPGVGKRGENPTEPLWQWEPLSYSVTSSANSNSFHFSKVSWSNIQFRKVRLKNNLLIWKRCRSQPCNNMG